MSSKHSDQYLGLLKRHRLSAQCQLPSNVSLPVAQALHHHFFPEVVNDFVKCTRLFNSSLLTSLCVASMLPWKTILR